MRVVLAWVLAVVVISIAGHTWGGAPADSFEIPGTESQRAFDLLDARFPAQSGSTARIVFHTMMARISCPPTAPLRTRRCATTFALKTQDPRR